MYSILLYGNWLSCSFSFFAELTSDNGSQIQKKSIWWRHIRACKGNIFKIAPNYNITLQEWEHDGDHVHVQFRAHPKTAISKFIKAYKSASSRLLKKEFPSIREKLWKELFWSQSYCLLTTGGAPLEIEKEYIKSQVQK